MAFDYINSIEESIVAEGVEGKIIMIYGGNNLGKSKQSTYFPNPITLPFEANALNAIGGAKKIPVHNWGAFVDFTESMYMDKIDYEKNKISLNRLQSKTKPTNEDQRNTLDDRIKKLESKVKNSPYIKFKEVCSTLVIDSLTALAKSAEKYVVDKAEVEELGDIGHGKLYKRFENEAYHAINKFFNLGDFTYLILAHEDFRNIGTEEESIMQAIPKGDWKRIVKPVIDRCDIIVYLRSNGVDENLKPIHSSGILAECNTCFARTKWENMDIFIKDFTAENLQKIINKAINEQKENGENVGSFEEQQETFTNSLALDYKDLITKIGAMAMAIYEYDNKDVEGVHMQKYNEIVEKYLGDKKVSEATERHVEHLTNILSKTQDFFNSLNLTLK